MYMYIPNTPKELIYTIITLQRSLNIIHPTRWS